MEIEALDHLVTPLKVAITVSVAVPVLGPAVKVINDPVVELKVPMPMGLRLQV